MPVTALDLRHMPKLPVSHKLLYFFFQSRGARDWFRLHSLISEVQRLRAQGSPQTDSFPVAPGKDLTRTLCIKGRPNENLYAKILDLALLGKLTLSYYPKCVYKYRKRIEKVLYGCTMISLLAFERVCATSTSFKTAFSTKPCL